MSKFGRSLVLVISFIAVIASVVGCSSGFVSQRGEGANLSLSVSSVSRPTNGLVQTSAEGSVTIDIEWAKAEGSTLSFNVDMNTHSVDLDPYDLRKLAILRDDTGNEYRAASWDSAPGGHHRQGVLTFPLPQSIKEGKAKYLELVIQNVAGVRERALKWVL